MLQNNSDKIVRKQIQAKHLKDEDVLKILAKYQGQWAFWSSDNKLSFWKDPVSFKTVDKMEDRPEETIFGDSIPVKVIHAKYKSLVKRKLIGGCPCGCRGDFEITDKGLAVVGVERSRPYGGY